MTGPEFNETAGMVSAEDLRRNCVLYFHPVNTYRMGPASDFAFVVDVTGKIRGTQSTHVVDASIMPVIPRANFNHPAPMLAERIAILTD